MSSNKKRKANIDSDEESAPEVVKLSDDDVKPRKKSEPKKKFKNIVNLSSDEEDGDTNTISINDIKKKAQPKAKNAIKGNDSKRFGKTPKVNSKTPHDVQRNNLFNYFQKAGPSNKTSDEKKNEITHVKQKREKSEISDEFMTPTVSKEKKLKVDSKPAPKVKSSSTIESSKELKQPKTNLSKPTSKVDSIETKMSSTNKSTSKVTKSSTMKAPEPIKSVKKEVSKPVEIKKETVKAVESKLKSPKESVKEAEPKRASSKKPMSSSLPAIVDDQLDPKRVSDQWVDRYKPTSTKAIIGQQGARSSMNKLLIWLRNWSKNMGKKPAYGNVGSDDGAGFRAVLISGPPGIGKTTTAVLACKELNYDYKELNASDVRNKKSLHEEVRELLGNRKLTNFFKTATDSKSTTASGASLTAKHVVIMDEVDGMSGNEDRGGVGELIQLIKKSKVPIICICNDHGDQKMRSLANYCFVLRFPKPRQKAIRETLQAIALKENVKIGPDALNALIASSNFDIRQCIHNLSILSAGHVNEKNNKQDKYVKPIKDVKLGAFEATKKVFSADEEYDTMTFIDKSDLFFADYNIMSLFVYDNYFTVNVATKEPSIGKQLIRAAKAIDSISLGEIIEKEVRQNQNWALLPALAAFSTVMPGYCMRSENGLGMPAFPLYMGRLSTTKKNHRIVDELVSHMALHITGTRTSFPLDYFEPMKNAIVKGMQEPDKDEAVSAVLDLLESYSMTKDNMDSLLELGLWRNDEDPMKQVESQTKAALTRAYTKKNFPLPYATENDTKLVSKPKGKGAAAAAATKGAKKGKKASLVVMDEMEESETDDNPTDEEEMPDFYF